MSRHSIDRFCRERAPLRLGGTRFAATLLALVGAGLFLASTRASAEEEVQNPLSWQQGPGTAPIGEVAEIDLPTEYLYLDGGGTRKLMELTQNIPSGQELATIAPRGDEQWIVVFEVDESGYVPDDEKDALDADAMLAAVRDGTEAANEERRKRGWETMTIVGWRESPHYDSMTNNLSWAIDGESGGSQNVNRIIKLLGRRGVMTATLVGGPDEMDGAIVRVNSLLEGFRFTAGNTYAEYVPGTDKLAQYGLTALVVGGAAAALAKSGFLAKLWKPIALGLVALGAGIKRVLFSGRSAKHDIDKPIT